MRNKTILVTGSAGFIGYHVAKRLLAGGNAVVGADNLNAYYSQELKRDRNKQLLDEKEYTFYEIDITDRPALEQLAEKHRIDKICHLAAQAGVRHSLVDPYLYEKVNVGGFLNILELARKHGIRDIVYASSSSVYGSNAMPDHGFSEQDEVNSQVSLYGVTKRTNELMAAAYHSLYGLHLTGLRFFTAYGPWGRPDMAYFSFTRDILEEKPIKVFNKGKMKRDFTYIDDIVSGVIAALDISYPHELFNLGNSHTVGLLEFISTLENHLGKKAVIDFQPMQPGDVPETYADIDHAQEKLGYRPEINIDIGLGHFVSWFRDYYEVK